MILHPQLKKDCFVIGSFDLCLLLLSNDSQYPWFILVPQRENIKEIHELSDRDQQQLMTESSLLSKTIASLFAADKINIAALGNMVPQLHIHHIVRFTTDKAWPKTVWGAYPAVAYDATQVEIIKQRLLNALPSLTPATDTSWN